MNYFLYKLKFTTAVHFGSSDSALGLLASEDHFCADTLFSRYSDRLYNFAECFSIKEYSRIGLSIFYNI